MPSKSTKDLAGKQAALKRYCVAKGFGPQDPKVAKLEKKAPKQETAPKGAQPQPRLKRHRETEDERCSRMVEQYKLKHLEKAANIPPYDVANPTRYPEVAMPAGAGGMMLESILRRYKYIMEPHGVTPGELKMWRVHFLLMNEAQLAALIRETPDTIKHWESGETPIPFSMWWVIHVTMQDPEPVRFFVCKRS